MKKFLLLFTLLTLFGISSKAEVMEWDLNNSALPGNYPNDYIPWIIKRADTNASEYSITRYANYCRMNAGFGGRALTTTTPIENVKYIKVWGATSGAAGSPVTVQYSTDNSNWIDVETWTGWTQLSSTAASFDSLDTREITSGIPEGPVYIRFNLPNSVANWYIGRIHIETASAAGEPEPFNVPTATADDNTINLSKFKAEDPGTLYYVIKKTTGTVSATADECVNAYSDVLTIADLDIEPGYYTIFACHKPNAEDVDFLDSEVVSATFIKQVENPEMNPLVWMFNDEDVTGQTVVVRRGEDVVFPTLVNKADGKVTFYTESPSRIEIDPETGEMKLGNYTAPCTITAVSERTPNAAAATAEVVIDIQKGEANLAWKLQGEVVEEATCEYGKALEGESASLNIGHIGALSLKVQLLDQNDKVLGEINGASGVIQTISVDGATVDVNVNAWNVTYKWNGVSFGSNKIRVIVENDDKYNDTQIDFVCRIVAAKLAAPTIEFRNARVNITKGGQFATIKYYYGPAATPEEVAEEEWQYTTDSEEAVPQLEYLEGLNYVHAQALAMEGDERYVASDFASAAYDATAAEVASIAAFRNLEDATRVKFTCALHPFAMSGTSIYATDNAGAGVCIINVPVTLSVANTIVGLMADVVTLDNGIVALEYQSSENSETAAAAEALVFDEFADIDPAEHVHNYVQFRAYLKEGYLLPAVEEVNPAMQRAAIGAEGIRVDDKFSVFDASHEAMNNTVAGYFDYVPATEEGAEGSYLFVPTSRDNETAVEGVEIAGEGVYVAGGSIIAPEGAEIFAVNGAKVAGNNVAAGVYVVRLANGAAVKVLVK